MLRAMLQRLQTSTFTGISPAFLAFQLVWKSVGRIGGNSLGDSLIDLTIAAWENKGQKIICLCPGFESLQKT